MQKFAEQIAYYLEIVRRGETDNAFHGLLDMDHDIIPELMAVFRVERDARVRKFLINQIWEYRERSVIPFLGETLLDPDPRIWQEALNGLVALASPAALDLLRGARARQFSKRRDSEEFLRWLEEAIEQAEAEMKKV